MSNQEWRILDAEGNDLGPYSLEDLQGYFAAGNINRETLVWTEGFDNWYPAGQVQGLLPEEAVAPPPVPPAPQVAPTPPSAPAPPPPPRSGAPTWLSITTLVLGLAALVFYFFPWVSVSMNPDPESRKNPVKAASQSGFQSITRKVSVEDEFVSLSAKKIAQSTGADEAEVLKEMKEDLEKDSDDPEWKSSILVLIALIVVGLAVVGAIIGLTNKMASLVILSQSLLAVAAVLIGVQMALEFPMTRSFVESQKEAAKEFQESVDRQTELNEEIEANMSEVPDEIREDQQKLNKIKTAKLYSTSFEPACFATVGLLALNLFLVVVTLSTASSTPIIIPQGNYQSPPSSGHEPPQNQQPGGGLRFH